MSPHHESSPSVGDSFGVDREVVDLELEAELSEVPRARTEVRRAMAPYGQRNLCDRVELAVTELITNAIEASEGSSPVTVQVRHDDDVVEVVVRNRSSARVPCPPEEIDVTALRGRGLTIVHHLSDSLAIDDAGDQVVVRATFNARPAIGDERP